MFITKKSIYIFIITIYLSVRFPPRTEIRFYLTRDPQGNTGAPGFKGAAGEKGIIGGAGEMGRPGLPGPSGPRVSTCREN